MKATFFFSILIILFTNCSEKKENKKDYAIAPLEDDTVIASEEIATNDGSLVSLSNERNIGKLLCQGWIMEEDISAMENNSDAQGMYPVRCFYLFDDNTYTRNVRNFMEHGRWTYNDKEKTFILRSTRGSKDEYKIAAIGPGDMIVINSGINSLTQLKFIASAKRYGNKTDDPYYIDNNKWRIKPGFSEDDTMIKKRLKDCIHFYILFYRDNLVRKGKTISFYGFPTCIKWYNGGIFMVHEDELADNWFECFYNKEQAMKAYRMMEKVVVKKYKWNKGNVGWVQKNMEVLEQMYENL